MIRPILTGAAVIALAACAPAAGKGPVPQADLAAELIAADGDDPPERPADACWDRDIIPAVIETVTEQQMVQAAKLAEDGRQLSPAVFQSETRQKIVQERRSVWFRIPCGAEGNVAFTASLQRALKARGLYAGTVTGEMNAATRTAIRRYQEPRGLDSPILSLAAARDLGLVAVDRDSLE